MLSMLNVSGVRTGHGFTGVRNPCRDGPSMNAGRPALGKGRRTSTSAEMASQLIATGRAMVERGLAWGTSGERPNREGRDAGVGVGNRAGCDAAGGVRGGAGERWRWGRARESRRRRCRCTGNLPGPGRRSGGAALVAALHDVDACSDETIPSELFIETIYYLERIARVDYAHTGSRELGDSVRGLGGGPGKSQ
jgi:3-dehydro-4-phosphotetronate decarboxylase